MPFSMGCKPMLDLKVHRFRYVNVEDFVVSCWVLPWRRMSSIEVAV